MSQLPLGRVVGGGRRGQVFGEEDGAPCLGSLPLLSSPSLCQELYWSSALASFGILVKGGTLPALSFWGHSPWDSG